MTVLKMADRKQNSGRKKIEIRTDEGRVTSETIAALAEHPDVFQRGGLLVHTVTDSRPEQKVSRPAGAPYIAVVQLPRLREMIAEIADLEKWKATGEGSWIPSHVPGWLVQQVAARQQWHGIRHLEAVTETPVLRPDGSVLFTSGYDQSMGVLYAPTHEFPSIPRRPTRDDAAAAIQVLLDPLCDFPFAQPEHRSAALAGLLTPLARHAFAGPSPLFVIDKNVHGAGGSLLADALSVASTGRPMARMSQAKDDDEERKRILSIALAGDPTVLIDNVDRPLGGAALDSALTGTEWRDRILGKSEMVTAPLLAVWFATGNNMQLMRDTLRRTLPLRLETSEERPEERQGFRYDPLLIHVERQHPHLVAAALTVLSAYFSAGAPDMHLKPWGSFESWSRVVRGALVWAGQADPALARQQLLTTADTEANALRTLLHEWKTLDPTGTGTSARRIIEIVTDSDAGEDVAALRDAVEELAPGNNGKVPSTRTLGRRLAALKGRVVDGMALDCRLNRTKSQLWTRKVIQ